MNKQFYYQSPAKIYTDDFFQTFSDYVAVRIRGRSHIELGSAEISNDH